MRVQSSVIIDRPVADVWAFYAVDHVRNHPRWDPDVQLEATGEGPLGLGSVIRRSNFRSGTRIDGTMEVIEFEPESLFGVRVVDGQVELYGFASFVDVDPEHTLLTIGADMPWLDESTDKTFLMGLLNRSTDAIKRLAEAEISPS